MVGHMRYDDQILKRCLTGKGFYFNKNSPVKGVIFTRHIFILINISLGRWIFILIKSIFPSSIPLKRMVFMQEISIENASLLTRKKIENKE